mgnify:FL=1
MPIADLELELGSSLKSITLDNAKHSVAVNINHISTSMSNKSVL